MFAFLFVQTVFMALISFAVTAKLICVFVFAYAKSRFSHDAARIRYSEPCIDRKKNEPCHKRVCFLHLRKERRSLAVR